MHKQNLLLYRHNNNHFRTVFKTQHGRIIYLELTIADEAYSVTDCRYLDRIRSGQYSATPQKLKTLSFPYSDILSVMGTELDRRFYGIKVIYSLADYSTEKFIQYGLSEMQNKYEFLIFIGEGKTTNGLPEGLQQGRKTGYTGVYTCAFGIITITKVLLKTVITMTEIIKQEQRLYLKNLQRYLSIIMRIHK